MGGGIARKVRGPKDESTCGLGLVRSYLYVFNVFLIVASLIVGGLAVWSIAQEVILMPRLAALVSYPLTGYLLLGAGVIGVLCGVIGCCGISKSDKCFLLIYVFLLLAVFLLEIMAGGLAYFYREHAPMDLQNKLNSTFLQNYEADPEGIDQIQRELKCCGASFYDDWTHSGWYIGGGAGENKVPDSCCKTESPGCGVRDHPSNIYYTGCVHPLLERVQTLLGYHAIAGLGFCLLQLFGVIFSLCLYVKIKDEPPVHL